MSRPLHFSLRGAVLFTVLFAAVYLPILLVIREPHLRIVFSNIYFPLQKIFVFLILFQVVWQVVSSRPEQAVSWKLWMFSFIAYGIGDLISAISILVFRQALFPSLADLFHLSFYALIWAGLIKYPWDEIKEGRRFLIILDSLIVVIGSGLVIWVLTIAPVLDSGWDNLVGRAISVLYPILGLVLLWGLFTFFRNRLQQSFYLPMALLALGLLGEITSDTFFAMNYKSYQSGSWMDLGWVLGPLAIGLGAILQAEYLTKQKVDPQLGRVETWLHDIKSWPVYAPYYLIALTYYVLIMNLPVESKHLYLLIGISLLITLLILRQVLTIRDYEKLVQQVQEQLIEHTKEELVLRNSISELDLRLNERTTALQAAKQQLSENNLALAEVKKAHKLAEETLMRQLRVEEQISSISSGFINLEAEETDQKIEQALRVLGEFEDADRSYIFQFLEDQVMSVTYEWCRPGIESQKNNLQEISLADWPWWMERMKRREAINITRVSELPEEAGAEKIALQALGIQSVFAAPLEWSQTVVGFIAFSATRRPRIWRENDKTLLKIAGEILVMAFQRKESQHALSEYAMRLQTLHDIDQAILAEQSNESIIIQALKNLFEIMPCRGGGLVTVSPQKDRADLYLIRGEQEIEPFSVNERDEPAIYKEIISALDTLERGDTLESHQIPGILFKNLFKTTHLSLNDTFLAAVPLSQQEQLSGFLCLRLASPKDEIPHLIESLREVAHSLAIALYQAKLRHELQEHILWIEASLHEKELLLKEIHHRVKNNLQVISSLLNLQTQAVNDPAACSALRDSQMRVRSMALIHEKLYQSDNLAEIRLGSYIKNLSNNLFHSYLSNGAQVKILTQLEEITIGIDNAVPVGLILNELISNSLKHAFPGNRSGEIGIELQHETPDIVLLRYYDTGVGLPDGFDLKTNKSLGMRLIYSMAQQLNAKLSLAHQNGVCFELRFPIEVKGSTAQAWELAREKGDFIHD